jgi:APA family basic amino acid/polyamine antiporter
MADIPENPTDEGDLKRSLGPIHLISLGIGCIIGAGIFVLTGQAAATYAGPGVVFSFAIAESVVCSQVSAIPNSRA